MNILLIILVITASLSPLMTFARLWQLKEWRFDRLREHLREEEWMRQLFGVIRPIIIACGIIILILNVKFSIFKKFSIFHSFLFGTFGNVQFSILSIFTLLNIVQIFLKKQNYPVWTKKTFVLVLTSIVLTTIVTKILISNFQFSIILLPILQPFLLCASLLIWYPVDTALKKQILAQAKAIRNRFSGIIVIGITGSVGKTTTKELLAHILKNKNPLVTPEHVNTEMGIAKWIMRNAECITKDSILIIEMGAYRRGEIRTICDVVQPTIGIITWIGKQHFGLFGSQKNIAEAKGELFESLPVKNGHAFLPKDCPFKEYLKKRTKCPITSILHSECHILNASPTSHNFSSFALAIALSKHLGLSDLDIQDKIASFASPPHTFCIFKKNNVTVLDDTYNVSPESFHTAIAWARLRKEKPKILFTPGIIELGKASDRIHEDLGKKSCNVFDRVIFLNAKTAKPFARGYQKPVETYSKAAPSVPKGSLLICIGRIPEQSIQKLLP